MVGRIAHCPSANVCIIFLISLGKGQWFNYYFSQLTFLTLFLSLIFFFFHFTQACLKHLRFWIQSYITLKT